MSCRRHELTDEKWTILSPLSPAAFHAWTIGGFCTGSAGGFGPVRLGGTCSNAMALWPTGYNRFVRWRKAGVRDHLLEAVSRAYDGEIVNRQQLRRVHQHGARAQRGR